MWIYKRKDSACWWVGYRMNGRQYLRSTKTESRKAAEKIVAQMGIMETAKRTGNLTEEFFQLLTGNTIEAIALKSAMNGWLAECEGANAPGTVKTYRRMTHDFLSFMHATDTAPSLGQIGYEDVQSFLTEYRKSRSATTVNHAKTILSVFFLREVRLGRLRSNPMMAVRKFKPGPLEASSRRAFTLKEIKSLYEQAPNDFWRFAVLAGFYTGLRLGDIVCLRWASVDFTSNFIRLKMIKTGKTVAVPMAAPVRDMLGSLHTAAINPQPTAYVWPAEAKIYQERSAGPFSTQFHKEMLLPLGLVESRDYSKPTGSRAQKRFSVSFHCLRHSFVTALKLSGGSQSVAKDLAHVQKLIPIFSREQGVVPIW